MLRSLEAGFSLSEGVTSTGKSKAKNILDRIGYKLEVPVSISVFGGYTQLGVDMWAAHTHTRTQAHPFYWEGLGTHTSLTASISSYQNLISKYHYFKRRKKEWVWTIVSYGRATLNKRWMSLSTFRLWKLLREKSLFLGNTHSSIWKW